MRKQKKLKPGKYKVTNMKDQELTILPDGSGFATVDASKALEFIDKVLTVKKQPKNL